MYFFTIIVVTFMISPIMAENLEKKYRARVKDSIIMRIVTIVNQQYHYSKPKLTDEISKKIFDQYLQRLDPNHYFFLAKDIKAFRRYRLKLDNMLENGDSRFPFMVYRRYLKRVLERIQFVKKCVQEKFDFNKKETLLLDRKDVDWPKTKEELNEIWRKQIKNLLLQEKLRAMLEKKENKSKSSKKKIDIKEQITKRYERFYKFLIDNDSYDIIEYFLTAFLNSFDPHSCYFNWRTLEDFNIQLKLSLQGIGAVLTTEDEYPKIVQIIPGGPAEKQGQLKVGHRIMAVAQENKQPESVVGIPLSKAVRKIRGKKGTKVTLTVLKSLQDVPFDIVITRDKVKLEEQAAKGEIKVVSLKNGKKMKLGIVHLPSFYSDFEAIQSGAKDARSTTTDVKRIVEKMLKKDKISGLLIDLRSNSGGSLQEVIKLAGLFIPSGPIVQIHTPELTRKRHDEDGGFFYDVPLVVLIDTFSASASEIFAAAMQDYERGVIVGQNTYGKGTVQNVFELDRLHRLRKYKPGAVKFTMAKFYRVTGASTQKKGVKPDILFPSFSTNKEYGESSRPNAMPWDEIKSLKYKKSHHKVARFLPILQKNFAKELNTNSRLKRLQIYIEWWQKQKNRKYLSLNLKKRIEMKKEYDRWYEKVEEMQNQTELSQEKEKKDKDLYQSQALKILKNLVKLSKK